MINQVCLTALPLKFGATVVANGLLLDMQYVKREDVILMAGCGNSRLTEEMFEDGEYLLPPMSLVLL